MITEQTWCRPIIVSEDKKSFRRVPGTDWEHASELSNDVAYVEVHNVHCAVAIEIIRDPSERLVQVPALFITKLMPECRRFEPEQEFQVPDVIRHRSKLSKVLTS